MITASARALAPSYIEAFGHVHAGQMRDHALELVDRLQSPWLISGW